MNDVVIHSLVQVMVDAMNENDPGAYIARRTHNKFLWRIDGEFDLRLVAAKLLASLGSMPAERMEAWGKMMRPPMMVKSITRPQEDIAPSGVLEYYETNEGNEE